MVINPTAKAPRSTNYEGAEVIQAGVAERLERLVMNTMLFENQFYASGATTANQIAELVAQCDKQKCLEIAIKARRVGHLRHAPLFVLREVARTRKVYGLDDAVYQVCDRPDMLTDLLALYWKDNPDQPLSNGLRRGLQLALARFNEYQLAKYNRDKQVRLRDVIRLVRPKPSNNQQAELWGRLVRDELATPDTWEVALSAAKTVEQKRDAWTRLLLERKLGGLALLRNLSNMTQVAVDRKVIQHAMAVNEFYRVLPFQFFKAAQQVPGLESNIDVAMIKAVKSLPKIDSPTKILVDVSGSMNGDRLNYACAAAVLAREIFTDVEIYSFSNHVVAIPNRRGMALRDAINVSQPHIGTQLAKALGEVKLNSNDRLIIITDEQARENIPQALSPNSYIINVAAYQQGVGYLRGYHHIHGISNRVFDYIMYNEGMSSLGADNDE